MRDALTLWRLELVRTWQSKALVAISLITPLAWLFLFGLAIDRGLRLEFGGVSYLAFLGPGLMAMMSIFWALNSGQAVGRDKDTGFLKEVLVAPVSRLSVVAGRSLGVATVTLAQAMLVLLFTALLGQGVALPFGLLSIVGIAAIVLLLALGFVGMGMSIAVSGSNPQAFQAVVALLSLPMFFLSGALQPVDTLPAYLRPFAFINPLAHGVDALRVVVLGPEHAVFPFPLALLALVGFALFTLSVGAKKLAQP